MFLPTFYDAKATIVAVSSSVCGSRKQCPSNRQSAVIVIPDLPAGLVLSLWLQLYTCGLMKQLRLIAAALSRVPTYREVAGRG
jgi:hypothetical protein